MLLTIAGSSCSGKTTVGRACAGMDGLVVHDFDEIGVPGAADIRWRQRSMERWLRRVLDYQSRGVDVLLTGQSPLGEVLATPSAVHLNGIAACLLDVADDERLRRLEQRDPGRWRSADKRAFVGWARWHRAHAADPGHRRDVIMSGGWSRMRWQRWVAWSQGDPRWDVRVIDSTARPLRETRADLTDWVIAAREELAHGTAALTPGWSDQ